MLKVANFILPSPFYVLLQPHPPPSDSCPAQEFEKASPAESKYGVGRSFRVSKETEGLILTQHRPSLVRGQKTGAPVCSGPSGYFLNEQDARDRGQIRRLLSSTTVSVRMVYALDSQGTMVILNHMGIVHTGGTRCRAAEGVRVCGFPLWLSDLIICGS